MKKPHFFFISLILLSNILLSTTNPETSLSEIPEETNENINKTIDNIENTNKTLENIEEIDENETEHSVYTIYDPEFWIYAAIATFLCLFAGLCSGLTVGYLSIDPLGLEIKLKTGTMEEKSSAMKIMPILEKHHLLLGTLLISNAFAMESLPVILHKIFPAFIAILISTIFVVIFGEILPQAYCTGPSQIRIADKMSGIVNFLMKILWVLTYPLALFLDWLLGTHSLKRFEKNDLKALIELHEIKKKEKSGFHNEKDENHEEVGILTQEETTMINSIIDLREINVNKYMIPFEKVFMLSSKEKINEDLLKRIKIKGYSLIPIFEQSRNNIIGIIKTKSLIESLENRLNKPISSVCSLLQPLIVSKDTSLFEMLMILQDKGKTICLISDEDKKPKENSKTNEDQFFSKRDLIVDSKLNKHNLIGLISIKDIFEVMIQKELADDDIHQTLTGNYMLANKSKRHELKEDTRSDLMQPLIGKK